MYFSWSNMAAGKNVMTSKKLKKTCGIARDGGEIEEYRKV
jgi:hypothetical protein